MQKKATLRLCGYIIFCVNPTGVSRAELEGNMFAQCISTKKQNNKILKTDMIHGTK